jgi:hypothetical protein
MKLLENWLPPDGAGAPVACLATTFTFDADFFATDCLGRFLGLSSTYGEGDRTSDVALMLEEEELLAEARVVVLADRSCGPDARNLRWDLLPTTVPGGLLHAKATILVWQRAMRVMIGSANLTAAGYRRQLEAMVSFDIDDQNSTVPGPFLDSLVTELRDIADRHTYGASSQAGPKQRALEILGTVADRVSHLSNAKSRGSKVRIALAPSKSGAGPLQARHQVWRGSPPRRVVALSPFWDGEESSLPGVTAVLGELTRRSPAGKRPSATFVVAVDPLPGGRAIRAPIKLSRIAPDRVVADVRAVAMEVGDVRRLHAKALLYEGEDCVAIMIGSSNLTGKGLGVDQRSHREINVWFGAAAGTPEADHLRKLAPYADPVEPDSSWDPGADEDELQHEAIPEGFVDALLIAGDGGPSLQLAFHPEKLPDAWSLTTPMGLAVLDHEEWIAAGKPPLHKSAIGDPLPSSLDVSWSSRAGQARGTWPVNVGDLRLLPPPNELRDLPVSVLLNVLASTRPLRIALETELRHHTQRELAPENELDPLRRFDSSGLLLHRIRRASAALWGLQQRLARPLTSIDALEWRLGGIIGPVKIAEGLVADVRRGQLTASEAGFLLGELALTVAGVDWPTVGSRLDPTQVVSQVQAVLAEIARQAELFELGSANSAIDGLSEYMHQAFERAGVK